MLLGKEIDGLYNDGFEGSKNEHRIFVEVFYGSDTVAGAVNFEAEFRKYRNAFRCSNSEKSVVMNQSSTKDMYVEDSCTINKDSVHVKENQEGICRGIAVSGCAQEGSTLWAGRNGCDANFKRMKWTSDCFIDTAKDLIHVESLKAVVPGMPAQDPFCVDQPIRCHLVESSSRGIVSSCYLLKRHRDVDSRSHMDDREASKRKPSSLYGIDGKTVIESKATTSPISQQSIAPKLLVGGASVTHKSGAVIGSKEDSKESLLLNSDIVNVARKMDSIKDQCPRLRGHINHLLLATGWCLEKRKRGSEARMRSVYISPEGRVIREFHKVWRSCGESLFARRHKSMQEENGRQWDDITKFWSDLSDTLTHIEKEMQHMETSVLARQWSLLDPFVTVVFINRQIGALREGRLIKANRTVLFDLSKRKDILVSESAETVVDGNGHVHNEQYRNGSFTFSGEKKQGEVVKVLTGVSVYLKEEKNPFVETKVMGASMTGIQHMGSFTDQTVSLNLGLVPSRRSWITPAEADICLHDVPVSYKSADVVIKGTESALPLLNINASQSSRGEQNSGLIEARTMEAIKDVSVDESAGLIAIKHVPFDLNGEITVMDSPKELPERTQEVLSPSEDKVSHEMIEDCMEEGRSQECALKTVKEVSMHKETKSSLCMKSRKDLHFDVDDKMKGDFDDSPCEEELNLPERKIPPENLQHSVHFENEGVGGTVASNLEIKQAFVAVKNDLVKKKPNNSKKISEIKVTKRKLGLFKPQKVEPQNVQEVKTRQQSREGQKCSEANVRTIENHNKSLSLSSSQQKIVKRSKFNKFQHKYSGSEELVVVPCDGKNPKGHKYVENTDRNPLHMNVESLDPPSCKKIVKSKNSKVNNDNGWKSFPGSPIDDEDLLVSAIIINKDLCSNSKQSTVKPQNKKAMRKLKSQKGRRKLLPRNPAKGGKHFIDGKRSFLRARTVLSWLIDVGVVSMNDVVQYRSPKDGTVVKDGWITNDGVLCKCCNKVLSVSEFKVHAGFKLYRPCLNLFLESGKPFTVCQLEAWAAEYKARKGGTREVKINEVDQNDDTCGLCGDGGNLICCDNCPSTFHQTCLSAQELPEGSWYCSYCTCRICGYVVSEKEASSSLIVLKCSQCEHKYHGSCLKGTDVCRLASDLWFCGANCQEVYSGLHSHVGISNHIADGFSWSLLKCIRGDQKVCSAQRFALMAECNSKLVVALSIMEECFLPMLDTRTGIDMIPHVLYNWGSNFSRLNYQGFYTVILEKGDEVISVASVRVHGITVAEMPLVATHIEHRRQGMCRRLLNAIEEMLKSLKVERLVVAAIPSLVDTWTFGFGFELMKDEERDYLNSINFMTFPGTTLLRKNLYRKEVTEMEQKGPGDVPPTCPDEAIESGVCGGSERSIHDSA